MSERMGPLIVDIAGLEMTPGDADILAHPLVGGVILFARNYESPGQLRALCAALRRAAGQRRLLVTVDQEGGRVQRFRSGFTRLPPAATLWAGYAPDLEAARAAAHAQGATIARELRAQGVDLSFAPVLDLDRGLGSVIGDRAFCADAGVVSTLGCAWLDGMRAGGMGACGKHFPGHGGVAADSHLELPVDPRPLEVLLAEDLVPFRAAVAAGIASLMMAHVLYPAVDTLPASLSPRWIGDLLRTQWGFRGAVFCDDLSMGGVSGYGDPVARAQSALAAGCDALPVCNQRGAVEVILDGLDWVVPKSSSARLEALVAS